MTKQEIMEHVRENGLFLELVENQTPEICMAAVQNDPFALKYVKEQTEELCLRAVSSEPEALTFVSKPFGMIVRSLSGRATIGNMPVASDTRGRTT